jgi:hypothetical protein
MQFLFLLLANVAMAVVFYLIISLKLERSASEFREKKLRKEMDEIIREFNSAAERNISLLESRIRSLRTLMEMSGEFKSMDKILKRENIEPQENDDLLESRAFTAHGFYGIDPSSGIKNMSGGFMNKVSGSHTKTITSVLASENDDYPVQFKQSMFPGRAIIEKDLTSAGQFATSGVNTDTEKITDDDIKSIIESNSDKYTMISELYKKGCGIEDISRNSGIPIGEVTLVLNLAGSLPSEN